MLCLCLDALVHMLRQAKLIPDSIGCDKDSINASTSMKMGGRPSPMPA